MKSERKGRGESREGGREGEERFLWRRLKMRERVAPISKLRGEESLKGGRGLCGMRRVWRESMLAGDTHQSVGYSNLLWIYQKIIPFLT